MNRLNKTKSAIFVSLMCSLLPEDLHSEFISLTYLGVVKLTIQRFQTRIWVIPYILYYKVYNSSCSQVGHDLIDCLQSLPEQIKVTATICKHILHDKGSVSCSGIDASMQ